MEVFYNISIILLVIPFTSIWHVQATYAAKQQLLQWIAGVILIKGVFWHVLCKLPKATTKWSQSGISAQFTMKLEILNLFRKASLLLKYQVHMTKQQLQQWIAGVILIKGVFWHMLCKLPKATTKWSPSGISAQFTVKLEILNLFRKATLLYQILMTNLNNPK